MVQQVGRFQLSAKDKPSISQAFKRVDIRSGNARPSSSGAGRKLTEQQKIRTGLAKQADMDPRLVQYGLPALIGLALGGKRSGILGALLGAGAGHFALNPAVQQQIRQTLSNYLGGGAGVVPGSSANAPATPPSTSTASTKTPVMRAPQANVDAVIRQRMYEGISGGLSIEEAAKQATNSVYADLKANRLGAVSDHGLYEPGEALRNAQASVSQADRTAIREWGTRNMGGVLGDAYSPKDNLLQGVPGYYAPDMYDSIMSGAPLREKMLNGAMLGAEAGTGWNLAKTISGALKSPLGFFRGLLNVPAAKPLLMKPITGLTAVQALPGEVVKAQSFFDILRVLAASAGAPTDPNAGLGKRTAQALRFGGESFGRSVLDGVYDPESKASTMRRVAQMVGSMAAGPIAMATAQGDAVRAYHDTNRKLAAHGIYMKDPRTGTYVNNDRFSQSMRDRQEKTELATGAEAPWWDVGAHVGGGAFSMNPFRRWQALRNAYDWWSR